MNFTYILESLAEAISRDDEASGIESAANINKAREPFLRVPFQVLNNARGAAIGLWLIDEAGSDDGGYEATLWQIVVPGDAAASGADSAADPDKSPAVVRVNAAALDKVLPLDEQKKIRQAFPVRLLDANVRRLFANSLGGKIDFSNYRDVVLPLWAKDGENAVGLLQLIMPDFDPLIDLKYSLAELGAATKLMAGLIKSGRHVRQVSAINHCQKGLIKHRESQELALALCRELLQSCSALTCAVYRPGRGETLVRVAQISDGPYDNPETIGRGTFSNWIYEQAADEPEKHDLKHFSSLASTMRLVGAPPLQKGTDLPQSLSPERTSWLSLTLQRRVGADMEGYVPILFIRLLTAPHRGFLGGSFSTTARHIVKTVGLQVSEVFSNLFSLELAEKLAQQAPAIRNENPGLVTGNEFVRLECAFASLVKELLWCIRDVYVAHRSTAPGAETILRDCDGNAVTGMLPFCWTSRKSRPLEKDGLLDFSLYNGRQGVDITVNSVDNFQYGLRCVLGSRPFARYEWRVLMQIVAELRFAQMGMFNLAEISRQTAEIRHALRNELNGVLGHLDVARDLFEMCLQQHREGNTAVAIRQLLDSARFRKSVRYALFCSESLSSVLENASIHMAEMKPERLNRSQINISRLLKDMRIPYMPELERREIEVCDKSQKDIVASCDVRLIKMALYNIFDNAVKYAFQKYPIVVLATDHGSFVSVAITNTGPHIKPEDIKRIFEPFQRVAFRGAAPMPGTGLGLPVSRKIAETHNGQLTVVSKPFRVGEDTHAETTFTFRIPKGFK